MTTGIIIHAIPSPVDSIRDATLTVSPNRQYLGIACPTTPVNTNYPQLIYIKSVSFINAAGIKDQLLLRVFLNQVFV
jgi:hypothetical protein